jgi:hypothetical protein
MAKAAAQIMKINGETIASLNFGSMSAAYSSVGELNILSGKDQIRDRFLDLTELFVPLPAAEEGGDQLDQYDYVHSDRATVQ